MEPDSNEELAKASGKRWDADNHHRDTTPQDRKAPGTSKA